MSGIYGAWDIHANISQYKQDIEKLMLWNKAYGNKAEEKYEDKEFCLGCYSEKLSETATCSAPVLKINGKYAVIDAVLYNRAELLEKGNFSVNLSDEELIFYCIEKFGWDCLKEINGDFAGAVYDKELGILTLFRDHLGVRPLFYYTDNEKIIFSTDIRGLVAMDQVDASVDEEWFFSKTAGAGLLNTEHTEFSHIHCVKPASYFIVTSGKTGLSFKKNTYWKLGKKKIRLASEEAYKKGLREIVTDSIQRRLNAVSGPVAAELSGGLDSGVIDILIHRLGRECHYFSWSASLDEVPMAESDERLLVRDICEQENIECNFGVYSMRFQEDNLISKKMQQIGLELDYKENILLLYALPPYINTMQISATAQLAHQSGAKVVFTGHGGDEGVSHRCSAYELFYHKEYIPYLKYIWSATKGSKHRFYHTLRNCAYNLLVVRKSLRNPYEDVFGAKDILQKDFYDKYVKECQQSLKFAYDAKAYINEGGSRNRLDVVALLGAYSCARYVMPYLDYRVVDYAVSIPRHMYLKDNTTRYIFREAFKDIMPNSLYHWNCKESRSFTNIDKVPMTEAAYLEKKKSAVEAVDKIYWGKYLNFNVLEQWMMQAPSIEKKMFDSGVFRCLSNCIQIQNVLTRSKAVSKTE